MTELLLFILWWITSGFVGFCIGTAIDYFFYKGNKPEWKVLSLCLALGPIVWIVAAKVYFDTWWGRRKKKAKPNKYNYKDGLSLQDMDKSSGPARTILKTDKCDWCVIKKATITDGTYVYCSKECEKLFLENALEAMGT